MMTFDKDPFSYVSAIKNSGLTIYDPIDIGDPDLWIPTTDLEYILNENLVGISLAGLPLRTRSKVVKEHVCESLGYPKPSSFKKTQPRFVGQMFDTYVQKSNNLQVWNEELSAVRRYVIIRVSDQDIITKVRVITGSMLGVFDTTGTLTQKYQARIDIGEEKQELVSLLDTDVARHIVCSSDVSIGTSSPTDDPNELMAIGETFEILKNIVGMEFPDPGHDQERNRGGDLHRLVCQELGYSVYLDNGQFPDLRHQLLEIKLQTSPTIDLGLVLPSSDEILDMTMVKEQQLRHCDVRYAVFYANTDGLTVKITHFILVTGEMFFTRFTQFQGKVLNKKLQIPLPSNFFEDKAE